MLAPALVPYSHEVVLCSHLFHHRPCGYRLRERESSAAPSEAGLYSRDGQRHGSVPRQSTDQGRNLRGGNGPEERRCDRNGSRRGKLTKEARRIVSSASI